MASPPLIALGVNVFFRLPFNTYTQKILQRRGRFGPILQAWNLQILRDVQREGVPPSRQQTEMKTRRKDQCHNGYGLRMKAAR